MPQTEPSQSTPTDPNGLTKGSQDGGGKASATRGAKTTGAATAAADSNDPIELIKADHRKVEQLFAAFEKAGDSRQKEQRAQQICTELMAIPRAVPRQRAVAARSAPA